MELKRLGKYEIVAKIGEGGMGEVYRAHDAVLGRDVAVKTMAAKSAGGEGDELRQRFHREARSAAQLNHPNIITIHDFGEEQGHLYIAMELLEGSDLKELITGKAALDMQARLGLMEQICDGLAFAHAKDIVHRDLKPGNIHVQRNGQVKIMDFGLARISTSDMTRAGSILGTPQYMSPEQIQGGKATARSDVFALGCVFYELLAGRKSFDSDSLAGVLFQIMQAEPTPLEQLCPELPARLYAVIRKALAKDPTQRYADAGELREALREVRAALAPASGSISAPALPRSAREAAHAVAMPASPPPATREAVARQPVPEPTRALPRTPVPATLGGGAPTQIADAVPTAVKPPPRPVSPPRSAAPWLAVAGVGVTLAVAAIGVVAWRAGRRPEPPAIASPAPPSLVATPLPTPGAAPALESARRRLRDRDYRGAAAQAQAALQTEPDNAEAKALLEEARGPLRQAEAVAAELRGSLEAKDGAGASQALARLVALDPRHPDLAALTAGLNALLRSQTEAARRAAKPPAATSVPVATTPPATVPPATRPPAATLPPPATTLPAATPPPVTQPPPPRQSEAAARQAIRGVLDEYRAAFERRDADALRAVQPGVDYDAMKHVFATVTGYTVRIDVKEVIVKGDGGEARCVVTYNPVPKPAGKMQPVPTVFHLRRSGDVWLIERLERK